MPHIELVRGLGAIKRGGDNRYDHQSGLWGIGQMPGYSKSIRGFHVRLKARKRIKNVGTPPVLCIAGLYFNGSKTS